MSRGNRFNNGNVAGAMDQNRGCRGNNNNNVAGAMDQNQNNRRPIVINADEVIVRADRVIIREEEDNNRRKGCGCRGFWW